MHPSWSAGVLGTARWKSDTGNLGRPGGDEGRALDVTLGEGPLGRRTGPYEL